MALVIFIAVQAQGSYVARDGSGDSRAHYFPRVSSSPTLPHVTDANARLSLTAEGVVVSGSDGVDGVYTQRGVHNARPFYNLHSVADDAVTNAISWNGSEWDIYLGSLSKHLSLDDVPRPDLVTTWTENNHLTPTVTHSPGQVTGAGYQVVQDDDGLTYTFNGDIGGDTKAGLWVAGASESPQWNGAYTRDAGTGDYNGINNAKVVTPVDGLWSMETDYAAQSAGIGTSYAWDELNNPWVAGHGDPPTVTRNPIASLDNWTP